MAGRSFANPLYVAGRLTRYARGAVGRCADALIRAVAGAVVARLDLDALVARVDVDRVADRVDVGRVAERVDVNRIADRVDVERIADRVDVNRIADRVDVNRIADRVDVDAVIARIDLVVLTKGVLAEIDLGRIVRDTGGGMAGETVEAIRLRSLRADRVVNRLADRWLRRPGTNPVHEDGPGPPPLPPAP
ncbi:hypothetical protein GCM10010129_34710 [Streptomyces fumigatiscleroticus]|nr:hypothetical protein GCM10010129_34710 [Streptomyces fumigatiscleroticus]